MEGLSREIGNRRVNIENYFFQLRVVDGVSAFVGMNIGTTRPKVGLMLS